MQNQHSIKNQPLSDFEIEFMEHFRALTEECQCMIAHLTASQIKSGCQTIVKYGELKLIKGRSDTPDT